jgi:hypothetical protein
MLLPPAIETELSNVILVWIVSSEKLNNIATDAIKSVFMYIITQMNFLECAKTYERI